MFQKISLCLFILAMYFTTAFTQIHNWISPIDGQVLLSGTFGELRGNHFHGGIDIKPNIGGHQPILAVADGYIQTIKIHGGSYGNGLVIQHKNGHQSLYGHMNRFSDKIDSVAYEIQYRDTSFQLNATLDSTIIPVHQGDVIGYMGNTGYSFGKHLHFEIHNPAGDIINPQLWIPDLKDTKSPLFKNIRINYLDSSLREYKDKTLPIQKVGDKTYKNNTITVNAFQISLAVEVVDLHSLTHNKNGIYNIELFVNDSLYFRQSFDSLSIAQRKYYSSQIDYLSDSKSNTPLLVLAPYHTMDTSIKLNPYKDKHITIKATDYQGNASTYTTTIKQSETVEIDYQKIYNYQISHDKNNKVELDRFQVIFPKETFIQESQLYIFEEKNITDGQEQWILHLDKDRIPLYNSFVITLKDDRSKVEKEKWILARFQDGYISPLTSTQRKKGEFVAKASRLGDYTLVQDTIPPVITKTQFNASSWVFNVKDNLFPFSALQFHAKVDGDWTLIEQIYKSNQLVFNDIQKYKDGNSHQFQLRITDGCGNQVIFEKDFK